MMLVDDEEHVCKQLADSCYWSEFVFQPSCHVLFYCISIFVFLLSITRCQWSFVEE